MIVEILKHTPIWVFGLFIFLIVLGFKQSKERRVKKLLVLPLPIGMVFLSFFGVYTSFGLAPLPIGVWFITLASMSYFMVEYFPVEKVSFSSISGSFLVPGSWLPFVLMMAIFFTKYIVGVLSVLHPTVVMSAVFVVSISLIYGLFSGMFIARAISVWRAMYLEAVVDIVDQR
jgi:hypothetical protein